VEAKIFPKSRQEELVVQELINEVLIYDLKIDRAFCLNETSAQVWKLCDGTKSTGEIAETISQQLNSHISEGLIWIALDQLKKENLLANADEIASRYQGMSRREMIRKVALTTAIALPVVSSLVAPTAAMAQSACVPLADACAPKGTPCCAHYSGPTGCVDLSGTGAGPFVCLIVP
jgi:hypothetical protein